MLLYVFTLCIHSHVCTACTVLRMLRMMSTHMFTNLIMKYHRQEQTKGKKNKLCNSSPRKLHYAWIFVCFCVCFCHTHKLHPVLIKTGWSFYVIMECGVCFQQILLLSLLFAAPQSSSRHIHHPAIPSYCFPYLCNFLHAFLLLPFPALLLDFAHTFTPLYTRYSPKDVCT